MTSLNKQAQELDARNIMQGLEEFATFMSFTGEQGSMRILSVETAEPTELPTQNKPRLKTVSTTRLHHRKLAL